MASSVPSRSLLALAAAASLWLATSATVTLAKPPGLPLPDWLEVSVALGSIPEVAKEFTVRGKVRVNIGRMRNGKYRFRLPPGVGVVSGEPEGELSLSAGEARELVLEAKLTKPAPDSTVGLEVVTSYPRDALLADVRKRYEDKPGEQLDALHRQIDGLTGPHEFTAMAPFSATEQEGFAGEDEAAFLDYFRPAGPSAPELAMLAPRTQPPAAGPGATSSARELFARNPKLAELFRKAGQSPELASSRGDADDYSRARRRLEAGQPKDALEIFRRLASASDVDEELRFAAANGEAVALLTMGRTGDAIAVWKRLCGDRKAGSLIRYAHFNLAEAHRAAGRSDEARLEYQKALVVRPAYTLARRRMEQAR
ncbi:MAG: tetratricopeptide repeat protein [Candidatus Wallbacteria bacterium]|nr:tetratricopeptide repeat protein [Candidatus Wallbacteria bacterium]